jgi:HAMP domain-containing protein/CHASE3 domain sensor protein
MTPLPSSPTASKSKVSEMTRRMPGLRQIGNLPIGGKLTVGFGMLVSLTIVVAVVSGIAGLNATNRLNRANDVRAPIAASASQAQAKLLSLLGDMRGYLFLGNKDARASYEISRAAFEEALTHLENQLQQSNETLDTYTAQRLRQVYEEAWGPVAETLFALRDDQLEREPAYRVMATLGARKAGNVLIQLSLILDSQAQSAPTAENLSLMRDMANFQGSFAAMFSATRSYAATRNRIYRQEYEGNLVINDLAWDRLNKNRAQLTTNQQNLLDIIAADRAAFLNLVPDQVFTPLEGPRWREDLYIFQNDALPLIATMQQQLSDITSRQQASLSDDLRIGSAGLAQAQTLTIAASILATVFGVVLAFAVRDNIAGPVQRLTQVAEAIRAGNLNAQAEIEFNDEIGALAGTFNNMTGQLRQTLQQVRKEKQRADNLLNVVIPIGVELTTEKDFNRLLEKMLVEAQTFCNANVGTIYLVSEDAQTQKKELSFALLRDDTRKLAYGGTTNQTVPFAAIPLFDPATQTPNQRYVAAQAALSVQTINITDAAQAQNYAPLASQDGQLQITGQAWLTIPLKNPGGKVLGVLQLIDPRDRETQAITGFDPNLQQMMESFSSLAVAALEAYIREQALRKEIQQLRLRIEIDEAKRQQQVSEIVDSESFKDLQSKAQELRERKRARLTNS